MSRLTDWHKGVIDRVKEILGISDYALLWVSFFKGMAIGLILLWVVADNSCSVDYRIEIE